MQKNIIYKISLLIILLLFGNYYLRSENTSCKKICHSTIIIKETESYPSGIFPYYPFFAEI